jgi:hypothetical protein
MDAHEILLTECSQGPHHQGKGKYFIKDGIVDPRRWASAARPKVLLLLKEAYHGESEHWDLREYVRKLEHPDRSLLNSAYWCYAIQCIARGSLQPVPFRATRKSEYEQAVEALKSSAIVNVKKSEGKSESSDEEIADYAKKDGPFIRQQIELIKPDVVVCGNTWVPVEHLWPDKDKDYIHDGVCRVGRTAVFINFWHPSRRNLIADEIKYYALVGLLLSSRALSDLAAAA